jgi:hypothetical protein
MQHQSDLSQRWRDRKGMFIPPDSRIDRRHYAVEPIPPGLARKLVASWHYSGSCPLPVAAIGLWKKVGVFPSSIEGVAVFGNSITRDAITCYSGYAHSDGLELTRFVLTDACEFNAETFFLRRALGHLRDLQPDLRVILSYSDPTPRTNAAGATIFAGHIGQVYCASNAHYCGTSNPRTELLCADGRIFASRTLSKINNETDQFDQACKSFLAAGAPPRRPGESPRAWVARAKIEGPFRIFRKPGNHTYLFPMDTGVRRDLAARIPAMTYPTKTRRLKEAA